MSELCNELTRLCTVDIDQHVRLLGQSNREDGEFEKKEADDADTPKTMLALSQLVDQAERWQEENSDNIQCGLTSLLRIQSEWKAQFASQLSYATKRADAENAEVQSSLMQLHQEQKAVEEDEALRRVNALYQDCEAKKEAVMAQYAEYLDSLEALVQDEAALDRFIEERAKQSVREGKLIRLRQEAEERGGILAQANELQQGMERTLRDKIRLVEGSCFEWSPEDFASWLIWRSNGILDEIEDDVRRVMVEEGLGGGALQELSETGDYLELGFALARCGELRRQKGQVKALRGHVAALLARVTANSAEGQEGGGMTAGVQPSDGV